MISTLYVYEMQNHDGVICHLIMKVETGSMGVEHFKKDFVDYADTAEEAMSMAAHMNAYLQAR